MYSKPTMRVQLHTFPHNEYLEHHPRLYQEISLLNKMILKVDKIEMKI